MDVEEQRLRHHFHYLSNVYYTPPFLPTLPTLVIACGALAGWDRRQVLSAAQRGFGIGVAEPLISC